MVAHLVEFSLQFMEFKGSLSCAQNSDTVSSVDEMNPVHTYISFSKKISFDISFHICLGSLSAVFLSDYLTEILYALLIPPLLRNTYMNFSCHPL